MNDTLAFIGAGNMARAIVGGLIRGGVAPGRIRVADALPEVAGNLAKDFGVTVAATNTDAIRGASLVVLAVKPQQMRAVALDIAAAVGAGQPLVLSIAAGITTDALRRWLGPATSVVRSMPNTPALIGQGTTVLFAAGGVTEAQKLAAAAVVEAVGAVHWVETETALDAVTALSGSGPAYVFRLLECLEDAGTSLGLAPALARSLALETVAGAAALAKNSAATPATLRAQVTSKGGTTEQALAVLDAGGIAPLFTRALAAAEERSRSLAAEFGQP